MGGYPLNPEKTVIIGSDGQARSYADHKKRDEELYLRIPEY
jgi:hypothetical protein